MSIASIKSSILDNLMCLRRPEVIYGLSYLLNKGGKVKIYIVYIKIGIKMFKEIPKNQEGSFQIILVSSLKNISSLLGGG